MASKSLGTLTLDLVAKIGGFTAGMTEAERAAKKSSDKITKDLQSVGVASVALGTAIGQSLANGIAAAVNAFPELIDQAAQFQDIADKTGGSAEGFANFAVSARVAGVSVEDLANQAAKLQKTLLEAGDDSKPITAGLKALNISVEEFKRLKPDEQMKKLAVAFGEFADGGEKAAVAQQILGKSGAETLKFFKDYVENGGDVNILTGEMIKKSDDFADSQARLRAEISLYASALAINFIEPIGIVLKLVKDAIDQFYKLDVEATKVGANSGVKQFAEDTGRALAGAIDYVTQSVKEFQALVDFVTFSAKALSQVANFDFAGASETGASFRKKYGLDELGRKVGDAGAEAGKTYVQKFNEQLSRNSADRNRALLNAVNYGAGKDNRPTLKPTDPGRTKKGSNTAAQEAKAQLDADLSAIKLVQKELTDSYSNQEKLLEAMRSAGLTDEKDYYAQKKELLQKNIDANVQAQQAIIDRLEAEKVSGKDAIDNAKKIAEAQAQLNKLQKDGATSAQILGIQEEAAYKKTASALLAARQAAQDYFDTVNQGYASTLAGIGQGSKNRDFNAALQQINEKYQQQRQALANQRSQAELLSGGALSPDAAKQFDAQLAIINEFQEKSVASYQAYYDKLDEAQKDWTNGATEALKNYSDEAQNTAKQTEQAFSNAFSGIEDALTDFVVTGKADFKGLVDSILKDVLRIAVRQGITGPLANALTGAISGSGSGGSDAIGDLIKGLASSGFASGGFTGYGAPDQPAGIVHKGEYVVDAETTKRMGLDRGGNLGGRSLVINQNFAPGQDRRTVQQAALQAGREIQRTMARNG